jgi:hypothetical protein
MVVALITTLGAALMCRQTGLAAEKDLAHEYRMNGLYRANAEFARHHYELEVAVRWLMKENRGMKADLASRDRGRQF